MHYWKGLALVLSIGISHIALGSPALQVTNPATLTTAGNGTRWEAGFTFGQIDNNFRRASTVGVAAAGNYDADPERPILPFFAISHAYSEKVSLGVALDVSNYLDVTWPDHTFDVNFGGQAVDLVTRGKLIATRLGPAVGIRIDQHWSTGARVFLQRVEALEDTGFAKAEGDGTTVGAQLGVRYIGRGYLVGAAFTTRTNTEVRGSQTNVHPLAAASGTLIEGDAKADILLPARVHTNFAYAFRPDLWGEIEAEWFGWSYVDERTIYQADGTISNRGKNLRHYRDVTNTRIGVKWQRTPTLAVYGAIGYEPTWVPERDVTPTQPFLDRTRLILGATKKLSGDWRLDTMYQYAHGHTRTVNATDQDSLGAADTHVYEGIYRSRSHSIRIGLVGSF